MDAIKYYYKSNGNMDRPEHEQGFAEIYPLSAKAKSSLTDHLISESMKGGNKVKVDFAQKSLEINKKHIVKVYNVQNPLTDEVTPEMSIEQVFNHELLSELYEELSNAVGDISKLKEGIKKK